MSHARVVWIELSKSGKRKEVERTIPSNWVIDDFVYWPNHLNVTRSFNNREDPTETWKKFQKVKTKCIGDEDVCESYNITSQEEDDDIRKPKKARKSLPLEVPSLPKSMEKFISGNSSKQNRKRSTPDVLSINSTTPDSSSRTSLQENFGYTTPNGTSGSVSPLNTSTNKLGVHTNITGLKNNGTANGAKDARSSDFFDNAADFERLENSVSKDERLEKSLPGSTRKESASNVGKKVQSLSQDKFKLKVLKCLAEIQLKCESIEKRLVSLEKEKEKEKPKIDMKTCDEIADIKAFDSKLEDNAFYNSVVRVMSKIGGTSTRAFVRNNLNRLMTYNLQSKFNLAGRKGKSIVKEPFQNMKLYRAVIASVQKVLTKETEASIRAHIGECLKQAPDRLNGGGRGNDEKEEQDHTEEANIEDNEAIEDEDDGNTSNTASRDDSGDEDNIEGDDEDGSSDDESQDSDF